MRKTGWLKPRSLTSVLYKLMSTSRPLLRWKNFTMGTLAVVIGRIFLNPVRKERCMIKHNLGGVTPLLRLHEKQDLTSAVSLYPLQLTKQLLLSN